MDDPPSGSPSPISTDHGLGTSTDESAIITDSIIQQVCALQMLRANLIEQNNVVKETLTGIKNGNQEFDEERLNAERSILYAVMKQQQLVRELRLKTSRTSTRVHNIGTITLSKIKLQQRRTSNRVKKYYLCAVNGESAFFLSEVSAADSDDFVNFNIQHMFLEQPVDFKITLQVFRLTIIVEPNTGRKVSSCCCISTEECFHQQSLRRSISDSSRPLENCWEQRSLFQFFGEVTVDISNANKTNEANLTKFSDSILSKLFFDVGAKLDASSFFAEGWLDVSKNGLYFDQRWCSLRGTTLTCLNTRHNNCDNCRKTAIIIYLTNCKNVRESTRHEITRNPALILEMDDNHGGPSNYYLSTRSITEFNTWKILEELIAALQAWRDAGCVPA